MDNTYRIRFANTEGTYYTIYIYPSATGIDYEGMVDLLGGSSPFTINVDDSTDPTSALHYSSGNVTFIDDRGGVMQDMIPSTPDEIRVKVECALPGAPATNTIWEGYIQQQAFQQSWDDTPIEITIPVVSRLGMIASKHLSVEHEGVVTVANLLKTICVDGDETIYSLAYLPNNEIGRSSAYGESFLSGNTPIDINVALSKEYFKSEVAIEDLDMHDGDYEPQTYEDVLSAVCHLFGWQMYEVNNALVCRGIDNVSQYRQYVVGAIDEGGEPTLVNISTLALEDIMFASNNHSEGIVLPARSLTVSAETEDFGEDLFSLDNEARLAVEGVSANYVITGQVNAIMPTNTDEFTQIHYNNDIITTNDVSMLKRNRTASDNYSGGEIVSYSRGRTEDELESSAWLGILLGRNDNEKNALSIVTKCKHLLPREAYYTSARNYRHYPGATLHISGTVYYSANKVTDNVNTSLSEDTNANRYIKVAVLIDSKYLTSDGTLTTNIAYINVPFKKGKIDHDLRLFDDYGYHDGKVRINIYTPSQTSMGDDWFYLRIADFKIETKQPKTMEVPLFNILKDKDLKFYKRLDTFGGDDVEVALPFGNLGKRGMLFCNTNMTTMSVDCKNPALMQLGELTDEGVGLQPIMKRVFDLLEGIVAVPHHLITMQVTDEIDPLKPVIIDGKHYYICGGSFDYYNRIFEYTLINIES